MTCPECTSHWNPNDIITLKSYLFHGNNFCSEISFHCQLRWWKVVTSNQQVPTATSVGSPYFKTQVERSCSSRSTCLVDVSPPCWHITTATECVAGNDGTECGGRCGARLIQEGWQVFVQAFFFVYRVCVCVRERGGGGEGEGGREREGGGERVKRRGGKG